VVAVLPGAACSGWLHWRAGAAFAALVCLFKAAVYAASVTVTYSKCGGFVLAVFSALKKCAVIAAVLLGGCAGIAAFLLDIFICQF
jgi:hypothetical protein